MDLHRTKSVERRLCVQIVWRAEICFNCNISGDISLVQAGQVGFFVLPRLGVCFIVNCWKGIRFFLSMIHRAMEINTLNWKFPGNINRCKWNSVIGSGTKNSSSSCSYSCSGLISGAFMLHPDWISRC